MVYRMHRSLYFDAGNQKNWAEEYGVEGVGINRKLLNVALKHNENVRVIDTKERCYDCHISILINFVQKYPKSFQKFGREKVWILPFSLFKFSGLTQLGKEIERKHRALKREHKQKEVQNQLFTFTN